jgi:hypothetical protein
MRWTLPTTALRLSSETFYTRMPLNKDLREFLELLNSNGVEYLRGDAEELRKRK